MIEGLHRAVRLRSGGDAFLQVRRHEIPLLAPDSDEVIAPGEVINVELPPYDFEVGGFNVEDTVVVGEVGTRLLTSRTATPER